MSGQQKSPESSVVRHRNPNIDDDNKTEIRQSHDIAHRSLLSSSYTAEPLPSLAPPWPSNGGLETRVFFDSRARNLAMYPLPNRFRVTLPKPVKNVHTIRLLHAMLPNITNDPLGSWLFGITITIYSAHGSELQRPIGDTNYPNTLVGLVRTTQLGPLGSTPFAWALYSAADNTGSNHAIFRGIIPIVEGFEIAVVKIDEIAGGASASGAVFWDPADPIIDMTVNYKNWCGTLSFECVAVEKHPPFLQQHQPSEYHHHKKHKQHHHKHH